MDNRIFFAAGIASLVATLIFIGLLIWSAIEDGRDQDRRNANSRRQ
jgi:hypothetical protein